MKRPLLKITGLLALLLCLLSAAHAQIGPLGALENPQNFDLSTGSSYINYSINLNSWNYVVRLPSNYSPDETYGLIAFNSAGTWGGAPAAWLPILDKYRLIWVGGNDIGNDQNISIRRGVTLLGAMRMTELYPNIDPNRIYASGSSGGSRMSSTLVLMRDDFFKGMFVTVGIGVTDILPDDFITNTSRGDEPWYWDWYLGTADSQTTARFAQQTQYNATNQSWEGDFREEEILTAHHLSMIPNGNTSKVVSFPGIHDTKLEAGFEESAKWINHPLLPIIEDSFGNSNPASNPGTGSGFATVSATLGNVTETSISGASSGSLGVLRLAADAEVRSQEVFDWNEDYGMRLMTALRSDFASAYNQRMELGLVPADLREDAAIQLIVEQTNASTKTAQLVLTPRDGTPITLCSFTFEGSDEPMNRAANDRAYFRNDNPSYDGPGYNFRGLDIHWFMDDDKFQINFRQNIDRASFASGLSTPPVLLIDRWTVQGRWSEMGLSEAIEDMKRIHQWRVSLKNEAISGGAANAAYVDLLELHAAQPGKVAAQDGSQSTGLYYSQQAGVNALLSIEAEVFHRQELQGLHRWVSSTSLSGYSGSGAVTTAANSGAVFDGSNFASWSPRLDYAVKFNSAGSYKVWLRARAPSTADDACWVGLNPDGSDAVSLSGFASGSYSWVSSTIEISNPGEQWLYLWAGEDGLVVDQILLSPNLSYTPSGAAMVPTGLSMNVFFGPAEPPVGLVATAGNRSALLDWEDSMAGDGLSYRIYRSTSSGAFGETPVASGITLSEYVDTGLTNNTEYFYAVTTVKADGSESALSQEASVTPIADVTYILDIVGDVTNVTPGGEFADYSSLIDQNFWGDSSDDDGEVQLSVSRTGFNGDVSITKWRAETYVGAGKEINYTSGANLIETAADAIAQNAFVTIKLDSNGLNGREFTIDALSLQQWRNGSASPANFQLAYDGDGDGFDAGDLIGSPVNVTSSGSNNTFTINLPVTTPYASQHEFRLYYWTPGNFLGHTHLFNVEVAYRRSLVDPNDKTASIDILGNTTGVPGGEFADYSSLLDGNTWEDSSDSDSVLTMSVSRTSLNGEVSIAKWRAETYLGNGSEIAYEKRGNNVNDVAGAITAQAFIAIKLDSTGLASDAFTLDSIAVSQWRNGGASPTGYQFAYDADGDGYDANDLIGSPIEINTTGTGNTFVLSSSLSTAAASQHEVRLYYWGGTNIVSGHSHLYKIEASYSYSVIAEAGFASWIAGFEVGGLTAPGDDFDHDGIPNAIENYFGTDPSQRSAGLALQEVGSGPLTTLTFSHPISDSPAADLSARYRWSKDLVNFYDSGESDPAGTTVTFVVGTPAEGMVTVTATPSGTTIDRLFITLAVSQD